jgi:hypothetical protein
MNAKKLVLGSLLVGLVLSNPAMPVHGQIDSGSGMICEPLANVDTCALGLPEFAGCDDQTAGWWECWTLANGQADQMVCLECLAEYDGNCYCIPTGPPVGLQIILGTCQYSGLQGPGIPCVCVPGWQQVMWSFISCGWIS